MKKKKSAYIKKKKIIRMITKNFLTVMCVKGYHILGCDNIYVERVLSRKINSFLI
jgi:hypothetical protein